MTLSVYKSPDAIIYYAITITLRTDPEVVLRYITSTEDILIGTDTYTACSAAFLELSDFTHDMSDDDETIVYLPEDTGILSVLSSYISMPDMFVKIEEVNSEDPADREVLFAGILASIITNPEGNAGFIGLSLSGPKYLLNNCSIGETCYSTCRLSFGDNVCGIDLSTLVSTRTILSVTNNKMVLDGPMPPFADYFAKGFLSLDGVALFIVSAENLELIGLFHTLTDKDNLVGKSVLVYPGCDKQYNTCKNRWNNEIKFKGLAKNMPAYSPYIGNIT